jgi:hypothetical protein
VALFDFFGAGAADGVVVSLILRLTKIQK